MTGEKRNEPAIFDLAIIGGGINGCGIARDAAGRGYSVYLCEREDLASGTSSASTKLIHGGLRYLEHYAFRLVREGLQEREVLWGIAPHIIRPLRFVLPHHRGLRPAWLLRLGLFLYDHLGGRQRLPATRVLDLDREAAGAVLRPGAFHTGFEYSDCWVDDARLVVLNALSAAEVGAVIATRSVCETAVRRDGSWSLRVRDLARGTTHDIQARALINASGPWVGEVLQSRLNSGSHGRTRLVKGSHIVVRRLFAHVGAYIFQNVDQRIVFAIAYEDDFTLIGTTDLDFSGDPAGVRISEEETAYLCRAVSEYLAAPVTPQDVVWSYAGVRSLYDDGARKAQAATRDYVLDVEAPPGAPPLLSIFGGKITTYRRLAEHALAKLAPFLPAVSARPAGWTAREPLPGGDFAVDGSGDLTADLRRRYPFLAAGHAARLARSYGTRATEVLGRARSMADLGRDFGATLTEAEVNYLVRHEWAASGEDVLWRRSKLGLRLAPAARAAVDDFVRTAAAGAEPSG